MQKLIKWLLGSITVLAVLMVIAIIVLPMIFDPNEHKPQIQQAASDQVGREVLLNGPIEWSVFPWVAINLSDVSIKNESGFKGDNLATVETIAVRVKLLPLLQKQIKIGQVELKQPNINLQVAQSGKSNWQSIVDRNDQPAAESSSSSPDIEIRGIVISNGQLRYKDASTDLEFLLEDLTFNSDAIKANQSTKMSLSALLKLPDNDINGQLTTAWQATGLTDDSDMVVNFDQLEFKGELGTVPLSLESDSLASLNLAKDTLDIEKLILQIGSMTLETPVNGQQISSNMALSGDLSINEFSLADLAEDFGPPLINQAQNQISGATKWSLIGDRLQLNQVQFKLDESLVKGDVDIKNLSQLRGQFKLNIDQLNLDQYLPEASESEGSASSNENIDFGNLDGQIKMQKLIAAGVNLEDITLNIKTQGPNLTIEPLKAGFYQGLINTQLKLQPEKATEKLQVTHSMQDFQAGGLLTDLMGTDYLTGLGQLNADVKIDQPFSERPLQSANGRISYRLTDGDIVGIDVFQIIQQSLSLLNKTDAASSNAELKTAFGLMEIDADIKNGVLTTNTLRLSSPYFDLKGDVEIDLDAQTIKGSIKPMLTNIPPGVLDQRFEKLINTRIPVSLKGSLLEPSVSIDVAALLLESQKAKIDEKKEELKEDLFDAILGKKKDKNKQQDGNQNQAANTQEQPEMTEKQKKRAEKDKLKRDLLEGLLGGSKDKKDKSHQKDEDGGN